MTSLSEQAVSILRGNDLGGYTVPTKGLYPFQWNWDSSVVALGWATFDEPRAWRELERLFEGQWDDGLVPHIVFHRADPGYFPGPDVWGVSRSPPTSGITQPPLAATAVRRLVEGARDRDLARAGAGELFPRLLAWHRWFVRARDPEGTGLVAILHPWESGMDNSPAWDDALARVPVEALPPYERRDTGHVKADQRPSKAEYDRYLSLVYRFRALDYDPDRLFHSSPFRIADVCMNAILYRANADLRWLAGELNHQEEASAIDAWLTRTRHGFDRLWDETAGIYRSYDQLAQAFTPAATSAGYLPLFAGSASAERAARLADTLQRWLSRVRYGVPSCDPDDPHFERQRYWRGPVWAIVNWMIATGLSSYGMDELAGRIEKDTAVLIRESGLNEYFDPLDGRGLGGSRFSWTAAMHLAWLGRRPA